MQDSSSLKLPVFDISQPLDPSSLSSLSYACREWGFFHIINHGVSKDLYTKLTQVSTHFFNLPHQTKTKIGPFSNIKSYTPHFIASPFFESLRVSGPDYFGSADDSFRALFDHPDSEFSRVLMEYGEKMTELSKKIVKAVLASLGESMDEKFYESEFGNCHGYFRINNYSSPHREDEEQKEEKQRPELKRVKKKRQKQDKKPTQRRKQSEEIDKLKHRQESDQRRKQRKEQELSQELDQELDQERQKQSQKLNQSQEQKQRQEQEQGQNQRDEQNQETRKLEEESAEGLGMHTDMSCVTIVSQDEIGGLQVRSREGNWMDINPNGETLVVNVGDLLHAWSNGRLRSSQHRVVLKKRRRCASVIGRLSVAFFWCFEDDKVIFAPDEVVGKEGEARVFKTFSCRDYVRFRESCEKGRFDKIGYTVKDFAGIEAKIT